MPRDIYQLENLNECAKHFSDEDKRTLILGLYYEKLRREYEHTHSYLVFGGYGPEIKNTRNFRVFETVRKWLEKNGSLVTKGNQFWAGYFKRVFERSHPNKPHPAQMKNPVVLKQYFSSSAVEDNNTTAITEEKLREIYSKIFEPGVEIPI